MIFQSEKNCQIEKLFGLSLETHADGKTLVVADFLSEAKAIYSPKVNIGYYLQRINGIEVTSYNINNVLQRVIEDHENPKLTFQVINEELNINYEKLLTSKTPLENSLIDYIKESMCSVLYICCNDIEYQGNDEKGVLYCFPRPFNQNFLYNTRGAYVTLNHLAPKSLNISEPTSSTVLFNNTLINVAYASYYNDLLLFAMPNKFMDLFATKRIIGDVVKMLEFLYGSLKSCFTKPNNVDKLDGLFARSFVTLLNGNGSAADKNLNIKTQTTFEDMLAPHSVSLPLDVKIQIDDAITELEAADYREWVSRRVVPIYLH